VGLASNVSSPTGSFDYDTAPRFTGLDSLPSLARLNAGAPAGGFPSSPAALVNNGPIVALQGFMANTKLPTPYSYILNFSITRDVPGNVTLETAYVGRMAHKLLTKVDYAAQLVNFRDPASGQTWEDALKMIEAHINNNTPTAAVARIPFIENIFSPMAGGGLTATQQFFKMAQDYAPSWTDFMHALDVEEPTGSSIFGRSTLFQQQFDSLPGWSNWGGA